MWWTGRIPGLSEEEDRLFAEDDRKAEGLGPELIQELMELLGDTLPAQIPAIAFERIPGDAHGLVKPRELHVRNPAGGAAVAYRGTGKTPYYRITNTDASIVRYGMVWSRGCFLGEIYFWRVFLGDGIWDDVTFLFLFIFYLGVHGSHGLWSLLMIFLFQIKQTLEYNGFRELTTNAIGMGLSPHDWVVQW